MRKRATYILTGLIFLLGCTNNKVDEPILPAAWRWEIVNSNGDLWIKSYNNKQAKFDYRIGAGGCIAEMRYCTNNNEQMFTPYTVNNAGPQTDNVIHWVFWAPNISCNSGVYDERFNINQAGSYSNYSQIISARATSNTVDVYAKADLQFIPQNDAPFNPGNFSQWVRYTLLDQGVIKVEHACLMPNIYLYGVNQGNYFGYFENWSTFWATPDKFSGLALGLTSSGVPNWYWTAPNGNDGNIPQYTTDLVQNTNGYEVVYNANNPASRPAVGFALGTSAGVGYGTSQTGTLKWCSWSGHSGMLAMNPMTGSNANIQSGSILYSEYRIVPSEGLNSSFVSLLNSQVSQVAPAAYYAPDYNPGGDLGTVFSNIRANASKSGTRTYQLGSYIDNSK